MIIIRAAKPKNGKKQFKVIHDRPIVAKKEIVNNSEVLSSKQKAWGNIYADTFNFEGCTGVWVVDETAKDKGKYFHTLEVLKKKAGK